MHADTPERLSAACERIDRWHLQHGGAAFRAPASAATLDSLAELLGQQLPTALQALMAVHDGHVPGSYPLPMRDTEPVSWRLLGANEIADEAARLKNVAGSLPIQPPVRASGPVAAQWWSPQWIPVGDCGTGDVVCIDTEPTAGGHRGQLVLYVHDAPERRCLFPALEDWLEAAASDLEAGRYHHQQGVGLLRADAGTTAQSDALP